MNSYLEQIKFNFDNNWTNKDVKELFPENFEFNWENIKMFSVLTGINGIGKSKILKLLRYCFNDENMRKNVTFNNGSSGNMFDQIDVILLHFDGNFTDLKGRNYGQIEAKNIEINFFLENSIKNILKLKKKEKDTSNESLAEFIHNLEQYIDKIYICKDSKIKTLFRLAHFLNSADENNIPNEFNILLNNLEEHYDGLVRNLKKTGDESINQNCLEIFVNIKKLILWITDIKIPLNDLNAFLKTEMNFEINIKDGEIIISKNNNINLYDLSNGEQTLLLFNLWKFIAEKIQKADVKKELFNGKNCLLILEEPDSFLNPKCIKPFLDIIQNFLVSKLEIQVIMTTHNPITNILINNASDETTGLYLIKKNTTNKIEIKKLDKNNDVIEKICSELSLPDLIWIKNPYKIVLVEGTKDLDFLFYDKIYKFILQNPEKYKHKINFEKRYQLTFVKAGGRLNITSTLNKSFMKNKTSLFGIIDRDQTASKDINGVKLRNCNAENIFVGDRYTIENYIYDPIYLIVYLFRQDEENLTKLNEYFDPKISEDIKAKLTEKTNQKLHTDKLIEMKNINDILSKFESNIQKKHNNLWNDYEKSIDYELKKAELPKKTDKQLLELLSHKEIKEICLDNNENFINDLKKGIINYKIINYDELKNDNSKNITSGYEIKYPNFFKKAKKNTMTNFGMEITGKTSEEFLHLIDDYGINISEDHLKIFEELIN